MNVTMCSAFRNASSYIEDYFLRANVLRVLLKERCDSLHLVLGEGDSTDDTFNSLWPFATIYKETLVDVTHNGPDYGHIVDAGRFKQLAYVCNKIWSHIPANADVVIWAESDLIWSADTMIALIDDLEQVPCVAPFVYELSTSGFYDCYGFVKNGKHFAKHEPYFDDWPVIKGEPVLVQIDSAGSCLVMNAELARHLTWPEEDVCVGLCRGIYEHGASVWLDSSLQVTHS